MTNINLNLMQAIAANNNPTLQCLVNTCKPSTYKQTEALKGRPDNNHGCNPRPSGRTPRAILLLLLLTLLAPVVAQAQFGGGSGTETNPYIITTVAHMQELATNVNDGTNSYYGTYFRLDADLDFSGVSSYRGIGIEDSNSPSGFQHFGGFFDGNGHVVRNLRINSSYDYKGLFNVISAGALVKNLTLVSSSITGQRYVGGIVGYMNGDVTYTDRGVRNCKVADDVTVSGLNNVGGIVGSTSGKSDVIDCAFLGTVTGNSWVGAITGFSHVHFSYTNFDYTAVNPGQHSQNCYIGGNCTKGAVGTEGTEGTDELTTAQHVFTIVYSEYISGNISSHSSPKVSCNGKNYYLGGSTVDVLLSYSGPAPTGYVMKPQYAVEGGTVTQKGYYVSGSNLVYDDDIYAIVLPSQADAVITVVSTEQKRDIGYEPWVSISIAPQQFTGSLLHPVVTITDNKSGTPVTLQENTDYKITAFNGTSNPSFPTVGNHDVYIVGIGDFGGRATAVFNIYDPSFGEGSGTETDPYIIRTTDDMDIIASKVYGENDLNGYHFRLAANLDYTGKTYKVIGNQSKIFRGNFDGNGHTISNVTSMSYGGDNVGLFGWLGEGAVVQNVHLCSSNIDLPQRSRLGGVVGYNQGGRVAYCTVADDVAISGFSSVGGIVGYCVGGTIEECVNKANVTGRYGQIGGIAGFVRTATSINSNLNFGAIVSTNGDESVGGITGGNYNSIIQNNYYAGNCTVGGVYGADEDGAMRGWMVSAADGIFVQQMPDEDFNFTGLTYDGIIYLGAGQTGYFMVGRIDGSAGNFAASAGTLTPVSSAVFTENYYALAMPTQGQDVVIASTDISLTVPGYGESTNAGWRFIASPVAGSIEAEAVGNIFLWNYDLYRFDQSETLEWRNHDIEPFELQNGQGYLYASETDITLFFSGSYNQATEPFEVPLVYDANASFAGWNLVGNPFPVAAYANRSYYTMNAEGTGIEPNAVSSATAIPVCTGLMVKADGANEIVTFSRAAPEAGPRQGNMSIVLTQAPEAPEPEDPEAPEPVEGPTRNSNKPEGGVSTSSTTAVLDKAIVSFNEGDQLPKFVFNENNAKLYIPQGGKDYAIAVVDRDAARVFDCRDVARVFDCRDVARRVSTEIPINFKAAKNGTYALTVNVENMDLDYLHLIDNMTGADVDLLATKVPELVEGPTQYDGVSTGSTTCYTFAAKTTDYASRFRIVFASTGSANDNPADSVSEAPFAYVSNGNIVITADADGATLQIVDMLGRVVRIVGLSQCGSRTTTTGMPAGVYVLRLIAGDSVRTQKIVID